VTTLYPSVARRRALKSAILAAARAANVPDLAELQATSRNWSKAEYENLASRFGIDADTLPLPTSQDASETSQDAQDGAQDDTLDLTKADPETMPEDAQTTAAKADVARLDDLWRAFDIPAHRQAVYELALRANAPAPDPVIMAAPIAGMPTPARCIGKRSAGEVFNVTGPLASLPLPIYNATDAPAIDPEYVMPECLPAVLAAAVRYRSGVFLTGPAGTGKTTLAQQIAARLGRPYVRISCTANTDAAMLVGMTVPDNGGVKFQPGILTRAISRPGVVLLIDEPSTARDGILYVLQALLDDARRIAVDETGDVFPLAPDAMVFLADNTNGSGDASGAYAGTRNLSRALLDRVDMFAIDYMPAHKEASVLRARSGANHALATLLINYAQMTRAKVSEGELPTAIGLRRLVSWARHLTAGIDPQSAAEIAFLNASSPDAREVYQQLLTTHATPEMLIQALKGTP